MTVCVTEWNILEYFFIFLQYTMRTFTVIGAFTAKGCKTKFRDGTTYTAKKPAQAASKAFTELCRVKRVRGVAAYYVVLREKTQGSAKKEYSYLLHRKKLDTPLVRFAGTDKEFKIRYKNTIASKPVPKRRAKCKGKSAGPMKKRRANQLGGQNNEPTLTAQPIPVAALDSMNTEEFEDAQNVETLVDHLNACIDDKTVLENEKEGLNDVNRDLKEEKEALLEINMKLTNTLMKGD